MVGVCDFTVVRRSSEEQCQAIIMSSDDDCDIYHYT